MVGWSGGQMVKQKGDYQTKDQLTNRPNAPRSITGLRPVLPNSRPFLPLLSCWGGQQNGLWQYVI